MTSPEVTDDSAASRWSPTRIIILTLVVAMVAMWAYVLYLAIGPGRQPPPDRLSDPAFATAAQARCEAAHAAVDQLPPAHEVTDAAARAGIVDDANTVFGAMLDDLAASVPLGEDGELVNAWLTDWGIYLEDRERYADELRVDADARLLVTPKDREQITEFIDAFTADNRMIACATPLDVG